MLPALFASCGFLNKVAVYNRLDAKKGAPLAAKYKDKKFMVVVYDNTAKDANQKSNVFRFDHSATIDRVLIDLRRTVMDRGNIGSFLESQPLPEDGSFKQEDLAKLEKASQADILLIGYIFATTRKGLWSDSTVPRAILKAVDLHSHEIINSAQSDLQDSDVWAGLTMNVLGVAPL